MSYLSVEFILGSFLIFVRVAAVISTAPFFDTAAFPKQVKLFLALVLTITLYPIIPLYEGAIAPDASIMDVTLAIMKELIVGVSMGLVGKMIFAGVKLGGELMSVNIGLSFASVVDPLASGQNGIVSQLFTFIGILIFLGIGGEAIYIRAMAESFEIVPMGQVQPIHATRTFVDIAMYLFVVGIQLAAPFIIVLFLLDVSLAIFAKVMPQANIFFISLPLKVGIGFVLMLLVLPYTPAAFEHFFNSMWEYMSVMLGKIGGG